MPLYTIDTMALVSLAKTKLHLGIQTSDTSQDDTLTRFINSATAKIENFIDRKVIKRTYTEYQDGRASGRLILHEWPADKPTELWDDPSGLFTNAAAYQIPSTGYVLDTTGSEGVGVVLLGNRIFSKGRRNVKVVYDAGYNPVPSDLEDAALWTIEFWYSMRSERRVGVTSKGKQGESIQFAQDLPQNVQTILLDYQRVEFPDATVSVEVV